ncbi:hypothetical protein OJAV_G00161290 [Oryzias javanicus]|uniref:Uncharacterized protein n=1 Tax=Oryzias javanicus TaxID=123683 RepID=A0A437CK10_ORYJA|nr:hypothetical protein OJAV_G00161290 [Oryzias javanicus]
MVLPTLRWMGGIISLGFTDEQLKVTSLAKNNLIGINSRAQREHTSNRDYTLHTPAAPSLPGHPRSILHVIFPSSLAD